jgi:hypothetical protein
MKTFSTATPRDFSDRIDAVENQSQKIDLAAVIEGVKKIHPEVKFWVVAHSVDHETNGGFSRPRVAPGKKGPAGPRGGKKPGYTPGAPGRTAG